MLYHNQNITRKLHLNLGGMCEILYTTPDKVISWPLVHHGIFVQPVTLTPGAEWHSMVFVRNNIELSSKEDSLGGETFNVSELKFSIPQDRAEVFMQLQLLKQKGLVVLARSQRGDYYLLGDDQQPCEINYNRRTGKAPGDRNKTDVIVSYKNKFGYSFYQSSVPLPIDKTLPVTIVYDGEVLHTVPPGSTYNFEVNRDFVRNLFIENDSETVPVVTDVPTEIISETQINEVNFGGNISSVEYRLGTGGTYTDFPSALPITIPADTILYIRTTFNNPNLSDYVTIIGEKIIN